MDRFKCAIFQTKPRRSNFLVKRSQRLPISSHHRLHQKEVSGGASACNDEENGDVEPGVRDAVALILVDEVPGGNGVRGELTRRLAIGVQHVGVASGVLKRHTTVLGVNLDGEVSRRRPVPPVLGRDGELLVRGVVCFLDENGQRGLIFAGVLLVIGCCMRDFELNEWCDAVFATLGACHARRGNDVEGVGVDREVDVATLGRCSELERVDGVVVRGVELIIPGLDIALVVSRVRDGVTIEALTFFECL